MEVPVRIRQGGPLLVLAPLSTAGDRRPVRAVHETRGPRGCPWGRSPH